MVAGGPNTSRLGPNLGLTLCGGNCRTSWAKHRPKNVGIPLENACLKILYWTWQSPPCWGHPSKWQVGPKLGPCWPKVKPMLRRYGIEPVNLDDVVRRWHVQKLPQWETDFWSRLKLYHEIDNSLAGSTPKLPRSGAGGFPTLPLHVLPNLHSP